MPLGTVGPPLVRGSTGSGRRVLGRCRGGGCRRSAAAQRAERDGRARAPVVRPGPEPHNLAPTAPGLRPRGAHAPATPRAEGHVTARKGGARSGRGADHETARWVRGTPPARTRAFSVWRVFFFFWREGGFVDAYVTVDVNMVVVLELGIFGGRVREFWGKFLGFGWDVWRKFFF